MRVLLVALVGLMIAVTPDTLVAAPDPAARAKAQREALRTLKKADHKGRVQVCEKLGKSEDAEGACLTALESVALLQKRLDKAVSVRDAQGKKMFSYFSRRVAKYYIRRAEFTEFRGMEFENRRLCREVQELDADRELFQAAARAAARRMGDDLDAGGRVAERARKLVGLARGDRARGALIESLRGPALAVLAPDLQEWARAVHKRASCVAALRALATAPNLVDMSFVLLSTQCEDPAVRRASFALIAAIGDVQAVDVMIDRIEAEQGVPLYELVNYLRALTGASYGVDVRPWRKWWKGARTNWRRAASTAAAVEGIERPTYSRYFGLELKSARVLLVLDRSGSMTEWVEFRDGMELIKAYRRPDKMSIAVRELKSAIDGFDERVSFNILAYGTKYQTFQPRPVPATNENRGRAKRWVEKLSPHGMTNLSGSLLEALDKTWPGAPARDNAIADTLVVLSDGEPNCGPIAYESDTLAEVRRLNKDRSVTIHTVFLGVDGNVDFMRKLAEENGGKFVHYKR